MKANAPGRIGSWRLLDIVCATMPFRMALMGGISALPEFGPADVKPHRGDAEDELPGSNISDGEQQQAIHRERARRWMEARGS